MRAADALLLVTPEYNFSPCPWARAGKPVAIMGATPGPVGTARVQYDLRKVLVFMNTFTVNKPEVFIANAPAKFNAQGELTDESTARFIGDLLLSLEKLAQRLR